MRMVFGGGPCGGHFGNVVDPGVVEPGGAFEGGSFLSIPALLAEAGASAFPAEAGASAFEGSGRLTGGDRNSTLVARTFGTIICEFARTSNALCSSIVARRLAGGCVVGDGEGVFLLLLPMGLLTD